METVTPTTQLGQSETTPQARRVLMCSVCRKEQDVFRCLGNSYGLMCRDCLAASGDLEE